MPRSVRLLLVIPAVFTLLVAWFAWSNLRSAPLIAAENLRGTGLSIAAAIEQMAATDVSYKTLARYNSPDIAYFSLTDQQGIIRFHSNTRLIGAISGDQWHSSILPAGISEQREQLGTAEIVSVQRTRIHIDNQDLLLTLALHTYRADQVVRRARTGASIVLILTLLLWGLTVMIYRMLKREEHHRREMRRRQEMARLGEMGALMAHEIRNPLAGIKGFAQLVQASDDIEQSRLFADKIVAQSLRMETLVNDLLAFAREDNQERQTTDLSELVSTCATMIRLEASAIGVNVDHTPCSPITSLVVADRIIQLLLNLMKNSLQAMPDGGVLKVCLECSHGVARIIVSDTGIGIPPENIPHIFEPFWTSKSQGTGLGLALCSKVAEEHNGSLTVASRPGDGAVFTLSLPVSG